MSKTTKSVIVFFMAVLLLSSQHKAEAKYNWKSYFSFGELVSIRKAVDSSVQNNFQMNSDWKDIVGSKNIKSGAITNDLLDGDAVTSDKIKDGTITAADFASGAIGSSSLANDSITSAKIVDGAIATADLADNSVTSAKIVDGAIATGDLADSSVTSAKIVDGTIVAADINSSAAASNTNAVIVKRKIYTGTAPVDGAAPAKDVENSGNHFYYTEVDIPELTMSDMPIVQVYAQPLTEPYLTSFGASSWMEKTDSYLEAGKVWLHYGDNPNGGGFEPLIEDYKVVIAY